MVVKSLWLIKKSVEIVAILRARRSAEAIICGFTLHDIEGLKGCVKQNVTDFAKYQLSAQFL